MLERFLNLKAVFKLFAMPVSTKWGGNGTVRLKSRENVEH